MKCKLRPITSRRLKILSDILKNKIKGSKFLDLFAGKGRVGKEAKKLGAKEVTLVEANYYIEREEKIKVFKEDVFSFLLKNKEKFDIIFLGPPHKKNLITPTLKSIVKNRSLKKNGIIVVDAHKKEDILIPPQLYIKKERIVGESKLIFLWRRE
jgi:16S rRNA (guanine(966)-N(2))-methyltransferase RsmD